MFTPEEIERLGRFSLTDGTATFRLHDRFLQGDRLIPQQVLEFCVTLVMAALLFGISSLGAAVEGRFSSRLFDRDVNQILDRTGNYLLEPVPLLRDYAFLAVICLTALNFSHCYRQWTRIGRLPGTLAQHGLLDVRVIRGEAICQWFEALQRSNGRRLWDWVSTFAAFAAAVGTLAAATSHGIYPLLDEGDLVQNGHSLEWWARPENGVAGAVAFCLVAATYYFMIIRHTIMGAHVLYFLARLRYDSRKLGADRWLGYTDVWVRVEDGIDELRSAIVDVFLSVLLGACVAAAAVYMLAFPPEIVVILVIYLIYNLLVFLVPWIYFNRQLERSKGEIQERLLTAVKSSSTPGGLEASWRAYQRSRELPDKVIQRFPVGALVALYLIPVVGIIRA